MMYKTQKQIFRILLKLARKKNIFMDINAPLPKRINGLWFLDGSNEYILLNENLQDVYKRNFVLAHEIGHSTLHKGNINSAMYWENRGNNNYTRKIEAEADRFANDLLDRLIKVVS